MKNDRRTIFGWAMYDWANSAYITVFGAVIGGFFTGTIMPGDHYWGLSGETLFSLLVGMGSILLMLAMPVLGAMADYATAKKTYLRNFALVGALLALLTPFVPDGQVVLFLAAALVGQFGYVAANVFYDGFLPDITTDSTIDRVSSRGFAMGYLGGGIYILFTFVLLSLASDDPGAVLTESLAARIAVFGSGLWWIGFGLFSLARIPDDEESVRDRLGLRDYASIGFERTVSTTRKLRSFPQLSLFIIAFILYHSGTGTVMAVSSPYAEDTLGLSLKTIALAFLIVQLIAFFGALMFGRIAEKLGAKPSIMISLVVWIGIAVGAYFIPKGSDIGFISLAAVVGLVLGGVQALSRSLYGSMIPEEASAEFFGFFTVFSKLSGLGPLIFGLISAVTGSGRAGILSVAVFFTAGLVLLSRVDVAAARESRTRWSFAGPSVDLD